MARFDLKASADWAERDPSASRTVDAGTIAHLRIGEQSYTSVVLQELLGHRNVKNYDGSWTEYGSLVGAPIELGS
jgi:thiosulfate/3-mercaptopyruvate sulfurtransferase